MIRKVALCMMLIAFACVGAHASDITGKWSAQFDTPVGTEKYTFDFKIDGSKLTGKAINEHGETEIKEGKVDGNTISFVEQVQFNGMDLKISYTGTVDGDSIHFTRKVGDFGQDDFTATRVK